MLCMPYNRESIRHPTHGPSISSVALDRYCVERYAVYEYIYIYICVYIVFFSFKATAQGTHTHTHNKLRGRRSRSFFFSGLLASLALALNGVYITHLRLGKTRRTVGRMESRLDGIVSKDPSHTWGRGGGPWLVPDDVVLGWGPAAPQPSCLSRGPRPPDLLPFA